MKRLLFLCALVMSFGIMMAQQRSGSSVFQFNYVYDAYRTPTYPAVGDMLTLYNFDVPLIGYNRRGTRHDIKGNWELFSLGKWSNRYSYPGEGYPLSTLVGNMAREYRCPKEAIEVYELQLNGRRVCYGIICARDSKGIFFIGNSWTNGAGYYLSKNHCEGRISFRVGHGMQRNAKVKPEKRKTAEATTGATRREERHDNYRENQRETQRERERETRRTDVRKMR